MPSEQRLRGQMAPRPVGVTWMHMLELVALRGVGRGAT